MSTSPAIGNLQGTFQGSIENDTGLSFIGGAVSRSDLYELRPGSGDPAGAYVGSFELLANGDLIFMPVPEPSGFALLAVGAGGITCFIRGRSRRSGSV